MNAKPARNLQEITSSQPAPEDLQIQSPPGPQQPIAKIVPAGLSTACAPHSLPLLQPVLLFSRRTRKSPTAHCSANSDKASLQGPDKASPGAATPHQVRVLALLFTRLLSDGAGKPRRISLPGLRLPDPPPRPHPSPRRRTSNSPPHLTLHSC